MEALPQAHRARRFLPVSLIAHVARCAVLRAGKHASGTHREIRRRDAAGAAGPLDRDRASPAGGNVDIYAGSIAFQAKLLAGSAEDIRDRAVGRRWSRPNRRDVNEVRGLRGARSTLRLDRCGLSTIILLRE